MIFEHIGYAFYKSYFYKKHNLTELSIKPGAAKKLTFPTLSLTDVVKAINSDSKFNPLNENKRIYILYIDNLPFLSKVKFIFTKILKVNPDINTCFLYNFPLILFRREIFNIDNDFRLHFTQSNFYPSEVINLIISHEIAHSIHHTISKKNKRILNGKSVESSFFSQLVFFEKVDIPPALLRIRTFITEGYADLHSTCLMVKLYGDRGEEIKSSLNEYRKNKLGYFEYNTHILLEDFNVSHRLANINSFDELDREIADFISLYTVDYFLEGVNGAYGSASYLLGYIAKLLNSPYTDLVQSKNYLVSTYPFIQSIRIIDEHELSFIEGYRDASN